MVVLVQPAEKSIYERKIHYTLRHQQYWKDDARKTSGGTLKQAWEKSGLYKVSNL